jgi:uncharacterized protein YndB with AHSA1/START domain
MSTPIGDFNVRRSTWIDAPPERVWKEFESFEKMRDWYGLRHTLTEYTPEVGGWVETRVDHEGTELVFRGRVVTFDAGRELTFEQDWLGAGWSVPAKITIRLTPVRGGTMVELFHHGFEDLGGDPGEHLAGFEGGWTSVHLDALRTIVAA